MNSKSWLINFIIVTMILAGCSSKSEDIPSTSDIIPTVQISSDIQTPFVENSPTEMQTPVSSINLGDLQEVSEGGFSFKTIPGYELSVVGGMVAMLAPGADPDLGPVMQIMGRNNETDTTNEQLFEQLKRDTPMHLSAPESIQIAGLDALSVEISGDNNGKPMLGRAAMVMVNPRQQFVLLVGAPKEKWESVAPYFDAVITSVNFTTLISPKQTKNLSPGFYAYTNANVIRDIVAVDNVAYTATLGGMVAWNLLSGYPMKYTPLQGMGHVSAVSITNCNIPNERIIIGTQQGISMYDSSTGLWDDKSLLPVDNNVNKNKVTRLFCDQANNRLLIGYLGLGILDLNNGDFQQLNKQQGLLWDEVLDIAVAGKDIWIANGYKGIARISGTAITNYSLENGMPDEHAQAIAIAKDGTVWVGATKGLMSFKNSNWTLYGSESKAKLSDINEIEIDSGGKIWLTTAPINGGRVCQFNPANGTCEIEYADSEYQPIIALDLTSEDLPIFGTSKGLFTLFGGTATRLKTSDQLLSNYVDSFMEDDQGNMWVGTDAGIQVFNPGDPSERLWTSYTKSQNSGMGGNWASSIAMGSDGTVWAAIINGEASRFTDGMWSAIKDIYSFNVVAVDDENRAWFGDDGKGIIVLNADGSQAMAFKAEDGLPSEKIYALLTDDDGIMWIGTDSGLAKFENGQLSTVFGKDDSRLPNRYIRDLALSPDGSLLIGMFTGVARYNGDQVDILIDVLKDGFADVRLTCLKISPDEQIWIGTDKGLTKQNGLNDWELLTTKDSLLTNYVSALYVDSFGSVWVGGGGSNFDGGGIVQIVK